MPWTPNDVDGARDTDVVADALGGNAGDVDVCADVARLWEYDVDGLFPYRL